MLSIVQVLKRPIFWVALIYFFVPTDLLPDIMPVLGQVDDLLLLLLACTTNFKNNKN